MTMTLEQYGIDRLSDADRLELIGLIWDSLDGPLTPVPEWHQRILEERLAAADANPGQGISLEEFKAQILGAS